MKPDQTEESAGRGRVRRKLRFWFGSPNAAAGIPQIRQNWRAIREMFALIMEGPPTERRLRVGADRHLDVYEMADAMGTTVTAIELQLLARRRQTRLAVYSYSAAGTVLWLAWLYEALTSPSAYARLLTVVGLVAVTSCFALGAFYNALVNWQIRTGRLGSAREFLSTTDSWWPS